MEFTSKLISIGPSNTYGITYPAEELEAMLAAHIQPTSEKPLLVTLGQAPSEQRPPVTSLEDVCARIDSAEMRDDGLYITCTALMTPKGAILRDYMNSPNFDGSLESVGYKVSPTCSAQFAGLDTDGYRRVTNITPHIFQLFTVSEPTV